jgi:hypothetical protein
VQRGAGVDAEFGGEVMAELVECGQGVGLAAGPVQGEHLVGTELLAQRMGGG